MNERRSLAQRSGEHHLGTHRTVWFTIQHLLGLLEVDCFHDNVTDTYIFLHQNSIIAMYGTQQNIFKGIVWMHERQQFPNNCINYHRLHVNGANSPICASAETLEYLKDQSAKHEKIQFVVSDQRFNLELEPSDAYRIMSG